MIVECARCGELLRTGSRLCTRCGTWLAEPSPSPSPPPAPAAAPPPPAASFLWPAPRASQRVDLLAPQSEVADTVILPEDSGELDEHTTISTRRQKTQNWTLTLPGGDVELVTGVAIVGRSPEFTTALPGARLVSVPDTTRSLSKNHAAFRVHGSVLSVEDLGSTNGVIVITSEGAEIDLGAWGSHDLESGSRVELGDVVLRVGRT